MEYKHNPHMNIIAEKKDMNLRPRKRFQKDRIYVSCRHCKYDVLDYSIFSYCGCTYSSVKSRKVFSQIKPNNEIAVCPDCICDMFGVEA
jgi:hypothetical protein